VIGSNEPTSDPFDILDIAFDFFIINMKNKIKHFLIIYTKKKNTTCLKIEISAKKRWELSWWLSSPRNLD